MDERAAHTLVILCTFQTLTSIPKVFYRHRKTKDAYKHRFTKHWSWHSRTVTHLFETTEFIRTSALFFVPNRQWHSSIHAIKKSFQFNHKQARAHTTISNEVRSRNSKQKVSKKRPKCQSQRTNKVFFSINLKPIDVCSSTNMQISISSPEIIKKMSLERERASKRERGREKSSAE